MADFEDHNTKRKSSENDCTTISELIWKSRISYLKPIVIKEVMLCLIVAFLILFIVLTFGFFLYKLEKLSDIVYIVVVMFLFFAGLALVIMILMNIFTKGGLEAVFMINKNGVGYTNASEELDRKISRLGFAGSLIGGSLSGAGLSLINMSREMDFVKWKEIRHIILYKHQNVIYIRRKIWLFPFALFCTPENFTLAVDIIKRNAPDIKIKEGII